MAPPGRDDAALVLPAHLADYPGGTAEDHREFATARRKWFQAHGIDPGDWSEVYPILLASWQAHGIPEKGSLARHRFRLHGI